MSLVNDMLRDLDARRREAPTHGLGTEKLVPSDDRRNKRLSSLGLLVVLAVLVVSIVVVFLLLPGRQGTSGQLAPVQFVAENAAPVAPAPQVDNEAVIAQAAAAAASQAVAQLETRLQQLEAQNRALLEAQQQAAVQQQAMQLAQQPVRDYSQAPAVQSIYSAPAQPAAATVTAPVQPQVQVNTAQQWTEAPVASAPVQAAPAAVQAPVSELVRSPRELSFEDRERLQVQTALQQWSSGQRLVALQTLDVFTFENPQAHNARETLAKLLIQQGEPERALQAAEMGLAVAPGHNAFRKIKARILLDAGLANEAVILLSQNAPPVPTDTEYHDVLATAYLANGQYDLAVLVYRALLQGGSTEGRWWYGLAAALDAQGYVQDAAQAYERALQQTSLSTSLRQTSQQRLQLIRQRSQ